MWCCKLGFPYGCGGRPLSGAARVSFLFWVYIVFFCRAYVPYYQVCYFSADVEEFLLHRAPCFIFSSFCWCVYLMFFLVTFLFCAGLCDHRLDLRSWAKVRNDNTNIMYRWASFGARDLLSRPRSVGALFMRAEQQNLFIFLDAVSVDTRHSRSTSRAWKRHARGGESFFQPTPRFYFLDGRQIIFSSEMAIKVFGCRPGPQI